MKSRLIVPVVLAILAASCGSDSSSTATTEAPPTTEVPATTDDTVTGDGGAEEPPATDAAPDPDETTTDSADFEADVDIEPSAYISIAAQVTVTTSEPTHVELTASSPDHVVAVPRTADLATEHVIPLVGMRAESTYVIDAMFTDESGESISVVSDAGEFTTGSLPAYFADHELTIDADRASPGYTIVEFDSFQAPEGAPSSQHLVAYDNDGEIVWYYTNTGALAGVEPTPAGTLNMFYWPFGIREVDILGNVVNNWRLQARGASAEEIDDEFVVNTPDPDQVVFQGGPAALEGNPGDAAPLPIRNDWIDLTTVHHENWPMPNGNILTLSTTTHELTPEQREAFCPGDPNPFRAISDVAVEFAPDGQILRTWDLWDAIDIDEHPGEEMCVTTGIFAGEELRDWNHANSVIYDPERDAIIISSRHTNQIVAFDHLDEEGPQSEVRWIIGAGATIAEGGDALPLDGEPTYYQHAVEVNDDGSLVVYDNGNARPGATPANPASPPTACTSVITCTDAYSRAVIYDVDDTSDDPADWSATQRWEHIDVDEDGRRVYSGFISDADVLENGNVLVTHGGIGAFPPDPADPLHILIREVVPEGTSGGDIVWELKGVDGFVTYRAERIPTFYLGPEWES